jgi:hypothetical protein
MDGLHAQLIKAKEDWDEPGGPRPTVRVTGVADVFEVTRWTDTLLSDLGPGKESKVKYFGDKSGVGWLHSASDSGVRILGLFKCENDGWAKGPRYLVCLMGAEQLRSKYGSLLREVRGEVDRKVAISYEPRPCAQCRITTLCAGGVRAASQRTQKMDAQS